VPFALAMANEDERAGHDVPSWVAARGSGLGETENIAHRIEARLAATRPEGGGHRPAREDIAAFGPVGEMDLLAGAGENDGVVADDRAAAQRGEADRAFRACPGMAVAGI